MNNFKDLSEAFAIFAKYDEGKYKTDAQHDEIFAGPDPKEVSKEDKLRLKELGWNEEDEGFHFFT